MPKNVYYLDKDINSAITDYISMKFLTHVYVCTTDFKEKQGTAS
jgi:hypothetical protein